MGTEALSLLAGFPGAKVLCVGDIMLDRYIYGHASRISPEAPVPVVHVRRQVLIPGGVGNVVRNLAAWGVSPIAVSVVGDDVSADALEGFFPRENGFACELIRDAARPTIVKTRVIAGIQQVVRFDEEEPASISASMTDGLVAVCADRVKTAGAVAVSDYAKGVVTPRLMREIVRMAGACGRKVAVDPKGHDYSMYAGADLVKPNRKELAEAVGRGALDSDAEVAEAARALMRRYGIKNILVTLSERGMLLFRGEDAGAAPAPLPSRAREVFDVTGAGDTVLASLAAAMATGAPLDLAARFATLAAGVVVGKVGTAVATPDELGHAARVERENG